MAMKKTLIKTLLIVLVIGLFAILLVVKEGVKRKETNNNLVKTNSHLLEHNAENGQLKFMDLFQAVSSENLVAFRRKFTQTNNFKENVLIFDERTGGTYLLAMFLAPHTDTNVVVDSQNGHDQEWCGPGYLPCDTIPYAFKSGRLDPSAASERVIYVRNRASLTESLVLENVMITARDADFGPVDIMVGPSSSCSDSSFLRGQDKQTDTNTIITPTPFPTPPPTPPSPPTSAKTFIPPVALLTLRGGVQVSSVRICLPTILTDHDISVSAFISVQGGGGAGGVSGATPRGGIDVGVNEIRACSFVLGQGPGLDGGLLEYAFVRVEAGGVLVWAETHVSFGQIRFAFRSVIEVYGGVTTVVDSVFRTIGSQSDGAAIHAVLGLGLRSSRATTPDTNEKTKRAESVEIVDVLTVFNTSFYMVCVESSLAAVGTDTNGSMASTGKDGLRKGKRKGKGGAVYVELHGNSMLKIGGSNLDTASVFEECSADKGGAIFLAISNSSNLSLDCTHNSFRNNAAKAGKDMFIDTVDLGTAVTPERFKHTPWDGLAGCLHVLEEESCKDISLELLLVEKKKEFE